MEAPRLVAMTTCTTKNDKEGLPKHTMLLKLDSLLKESDVFDGIFHTHKEDSTENSNQVHVIKEDCSKEQLCAFVRMLGFSQRDCVSYAFVKNQDLVASDVERCLPLAWKYNCNGILNLCFDTIQIKSKQSPSEWAYATAAYERIAGNDPHRTWDFNMDALRSLGMYYEYIDDSQRRDFQDAMSKRTALKLLDFYRLENHRHKRNNQKDTSDMDLPKKHRKLA